MMAGSTEDSIQFNTTVLVELVELRAVDAAEVIEQAFANDCLDIGKMGNWEDVRQELGVEGLGLDMPKDPYNSLGDLTRQVGMGIFSDQPIFNALLWNTRWPHEIPALALPTFFRYNGLRERSSSRYRKILLCQKSIIATLK
jgi:hypothetical protein